MLLDLNLSLLFVTHDRSFLDRVCTGIVELDRGLLRKYPGNYLAYEGLKDAEISAEALANARADKLLAQEEAWSRKGVEARRTKSLARLDRLSVLRDQRSERRDQLGQVAMAVSRVSRVENWWQTSARSACALETRCWWRLSLVRRTCTWSQAIR